MNLPTAEVDVDQAKEAAEHYRDAVKRSRSAEDRMLATAYEAAAEGAQLLNLSEALRAAGTYEIEAATFRQKQTVTVPRLAIAPANLEYVWTRGVDDAGGCRLQLKREVGLGNRKDVWRLPAGTFEPSENRTVRAYPQNPHMQDACRIAAMVPIVPPPLRPDDSLAKYHVLWEAEWKDVGQPPLPPGDPALLRHLGGDMYAVLAVWDLTEIERAVLAGRTVPDE